MQTMLNNKIVKVGFVLVPVALVAIALFLFSVLPKSNTVDIEGYVEISTTPYFSKVNGTVAELPVEMGASMKTGDVLAVVDSKIIDNEIQQLNSMLIIKNAKLKDLAKDPKVGAIVAATKSAQDNVAVCVEKLATAERNLQNAKEDLKTQAILYESGSVSQKDLKNYETAVEEAASAVTIARAQLDSAKNNVNAIEYPERNSNEIEAAQADIRLTELQVENLESSKEDYVMKALQNGVVVSKNIDIGSNVVLGQSLFELSKEDDQYFVFYLPEEYVEAIAFGDKLDLYKLNSDKKLGTATICYIDWKAIYTPKDFETGVNKSKKSIKIKALIESAESLSVGETMVTRIENGKETKSL